MVSRREFIVQFSLGSVALAANHAALAQSAMLAEDSAQAIAVGYKADASKVSKEKYPKYSADQLCSNCSLFQGDSNDTNGPCPLFAGKQVAAKGWCSAWAQMA